jgi:hypothetical protein
MPMPNYDEFRLLAASWHGGQMSALYALASTGQVPDPVQLADEVERCMNEDTEEAEADFEPLAELLRAAERHVAQRAAATDDGKHDLSVCTDCLMLIANDDTTALDDAEAEQLRRSVADRWPSAEWYLVPGDEYHEFSRRWCDGCGTTLAGARNEAQAVRKTREDQDHE